ncbi:MAG: Hsp20/alpha crystallin family protein [Ilumatobacteraceae bacterium]
MLTVDLPGVSPEHVSGAGRRARSLTISVAEQSGTEASNWQRSFRLGAALDPSRSMLTTSTDDSPSP